MKTGLDNGAEPAELTRLLAEGMVARGGGQSASGSSIAQSLRIIAAEGRGVVVLIRNREHEKQTFHRFSIAVWVLWLIPYIIGAASAMAG